MTIKTIIISTVMYSGHADIRSVIQQSVCTINMVVLPINLARW